MKSQEDISGSFEDLWVNPVAQFVKTHEMRITASLLEKSGGEKTGRSEYFVSSTSYYYVSSVNHKAHEI